MDEKHLDTLGHGQLEYLIDQISVRVRLLKAKQDVKSELEKLTEREILLLELLHSRGQMSVSDIAKAYPVVGESAISQAITKLWRTRKLVSKENDINNQRVKLVKLTSKGQSLLREIQRNKAQRYAALIEALNLDVQEQKMLENILRNAVALLDKKFGL